MGGGMGEKGATGRHYNATCAQGKAPACQRCKSAGCKQCTATPPLLKLCRRRGHLAG